MAVRRDDDAGLAAGHGVRAEAKLVAPSWYPDGSNCQEISSRHDWSSRAGEKGEVGVGWQKRRRAGEEAKEVR